MWEEYDADNEENAHCEIRIESSGVQIEEEDLQRDDQRVREGQTLECHACDVGPLPNDENCVVECDVFVASHTHC
jgi:hypothetical protein